MHSIIVQRCVVADPGFTVGGGANPPGGGNLRICQNFSKKCMKLQTFWAIGGGGAASAPFDPPLMSSH